MSTLPAYDRVLSAFDRKLSKQESDDFFRNVVPEDLPPPEKVRLFDGVPMPRVPGGAE